MSVDIQIKTLHKRPQNTRLASSQSNSGGRTAFAQSTSDALSMRVVLTDPTQSTSDFPAALSGGPTHVVRLSCNELRFDHADSLDPSQRIWLQMRLGCPETDEQVVVVCATVISSAGKKDHLGNKCFDTRVQFVDCDNNFHAIVQKHIEDVIAKMCKNRREYNYVPGGLTHTAA